MTNPSSMENRKVFWQNHIAAWKTSGGTQRAYCAQHKLSNWSFSTWKKRLAKDASSFVEVPKQAPETSMAQSYEIVINDVVLRVPKNYAADSLKSLLTLIRQSC